MIATGWTSPDGVTASLSHLTDPTAFMPHGITGFFAGFQIAIFSFTGIELLGTMTAEPAIRSAFCPRQSMLCRCGLSSSICCRWW